MIENDCSHTQLQLQTPINGCDDLKFEMKEKLVQCWQFFI